MYVFLTVVN